ncbi:hypothetical protein AOLI_G00206110 [Acnodon oligacanthus]
MGKSFTVTVTHQPVPACSSSLRLPPHASAPALYPQALSLLLLPTALETRCPLFHARGEVQGHCPELLEFWAGVLSFVLAQGTETKNSHLVTLFVWMERNEHRRKEWEASLNIFGVVQQWRQAMLAPNAVLAGARERRRVWGWGKGARAGREGEQISAAPCLRGADKIPGFSHCDRSAQTL